MVGSNPAKRVLIIHSPYITSAQKIPDQAIGQHRIITDEYEPSLYRMLDEDSYFYNIETLPIKRLQKQLSDGTWYDWMTDDPQHWYTMAEMALRCYGRVLVIGLGLGLIHYHLNNNLQVSMVDTIEMNKDVMDMVGAYAMYSPGKQYLGDCFTAVPQLAKDGNQYDTIFFDIWGGDDIEYNYKQYIRAKTMCEILYPAARHLYHGYQNEVDIEQFIVEWDKRIAAGLVKE